MVLSASENTTSTHSARLERQQRALLEISRTWRRYEADLDRAIRAITETAATALEVERSSVWMLDASRKSIQCRQLYEAGPHRHSSGLELFAKDYPAYFAALESEEVIAAHDAHQDPRTREFSESYLTPSGIGAMLDAPIRKGGRLVGVLCSEHMGGARQWHLDEQNTGAYLASLVSLAMEFQQRRTSELELARSLSMLRAAFEATEEGVLAFDECGNAVNYNHRLLEMWGLEPPSAGAGDFSRGLLEEMASRTLKAGEFLSAVRRRMKIRDGGASDGVELQDGRFLEWTCRAQMLHGDPIGCVLSFRDVTHQKEIERELRATGKQLRELSIRDPLTGLYNRRHAGERLEEEILRARRSGRPMSLAIVDIDIFKQVNDEHGHQRGDQVLTSVSADLRNHLRRTDYVARWGGEEFLILLPDTRRNEAMRLLDEVRRHIGRPRKGLPTITVSVGVAALTDASSAEGLFSAADRRMLHAKRTGRNRVA